MQLATGVIKTYFEKLGIAGSKFTAREGAPLPRLLHDG